MNTPATSVAVVIKGADIRAGSRPMRLNSKGNAAPAVAATDQVCGSEVEWAPRLHEASTQRQLLYTFGKVVSTLERSGVENSVSAQEL